MTAPGNDPTVITVGSQNSRSTVSRVDDVVNHFSSRGPTRGAWFDAAGNAHPDNLIKLSLGVGFTDNPSKDQPWQSLNASYAMAGQHGALNEFTLDGTSNTLHDQGRGSIAQAWTPPGDAFSLIPGRSRTTVL